MPTRLVSVLCFSLAAFGLVEQISAEILAKACNSVATDIKRRQCWPEPFVGPDRAAVRLPFARQVEVGWRKQNMLGEYHFDERGQLNEAGKNKVRWILTSCPQQHRSIYVHAATQSEATDVRMAAVQQYAVDVMPNNVPPILTTNAAENGWSANYVDAIERKYYSTIPAPRLPAASSSDSSSGTMAK